MALEPIDCTTRSKEIEQQYQTVVRGTDPDTTWLIIGPNANKEYGPEATGNDFSQFLHSFDDASVQYGLARVSPPGSDVYKLVLVGWCPDSAPLRSRSSFASNFASVANNVLSGYHIQVTARDEDDLDVDALLMRVSNAAGARYSIQATQAATTTTPVKKSFVPVKKTSVPVEKSFTREAVPPPVKSVSPPPDDDWDEPEVEERDLDVEPLKPAPSNYKPIGKIDLQNVIKEEQNKSDPRIVKSVDSSRIVKSVDSSRIDPGKDIAFLKQKSKLQRDNEIDSFLQSHHNDKVIKGFKTEKSPAQLWAERKAKESSSQESKQEESGASPQEAPEEAPQEKHEDVADLKSRFEHLNTANDNEPQIIKPNRFVPPVKDLQDDTTTTTTTTPPSMKNIGTPLPGMNGAIATATTTTATATTTATTTTTNDNDDNDEDDDWSDDDEQEQEHVPLRKQNFQLPPRNVQVEAETEAEAEVEVEEKEEQDLPPPSLPSRNVPEPSPVREPSPEEEAPPLPSRNTAASRNTAESNYVPPPPPRRVVQEETEPNLPWAIAEYDYDAGEDNELTFQENDKIINIDFVDDDWWLGELEKSGEKGLFPSNYVTLGEAH